MAALFQIPFVSLRVCLPQEPGSDVCLFWYGRVTTFALAIHFHSPVAIVTTVTRKRAQDSCFLNTFLHKPSSLPSPPQSEKMLESSEIVKLKAGIRTNARKLVELANDNDCSDREYGVFAENRSDGVRALVAQFPISYKGKDIPYQVIMAGAPRDTQEEAMLALLEETEDLVRERSGGGEENGSTTSDSAVSIESLMAEIASMLDPIPPSEPDPDQEILEEWAASPLPYSPPENPVFLNGVPVPSPLVIRKKANSLSHSSSVPRPRYEVPMNAVQNQNTMPPPRGAPSRPARNQPNNPFVVQRKPVPNASYTQAAGSLTHGRRNTLPSGPLPSLNTSPPRVEPSPERPSLNPRTRSETTNRSLLHRLSISNRRRANPFARPFPVQEEKKNDTSGQ
ncbi:hypothetical protein K490DRAFT_67417 [Saccharata proteae CBS 121410]|uniref:Uncharacterized protein n=1 Tax=Saccharata proteae CBS 121410 TaxID=1314787 RepID=A0A9P4HTP3_9PEZI|nr:hypothetical protein K490DRAFT_67417 [Saccharata proteae CBS 121410]